MAVSFFRRMCFQWRDWTMKDTNLQATVERTPSRLSDYDGSGLKSLETRRSHDMAHNYLMHSLLPYQPTTGQSDRHQSSLFSSHLSNWKLESVHFLLQPAPFLWNTLPKEMCQPSADDLSVCLALTRGSFHKRLKTHLFSKSYPP